MAKTHLYNRINRNELKKRIQETDEKRITLSFYKYIQLKNPKFFRDHLFGLYQSVGVLGRIYVAKEGINAQLSVPESQFEAFKKLMDSIWFFQKMRLNIAIEDDGKSFFALIIKVRDKIVADGIEDSNFDSSKIGTHLKAAEFNALTADPNTILIDMRNHYESEVGHFKNALKPQVNTFRESLPIVTDLLADAKEKNIVMYCTGGIRCEKASAYLKYNGFENVFQLEGGIIEYARQVNEQNLENRFIGKNFVFDERLGERISPEIIAKCHQCGTPNDNHTNCMNHFCHLLFIQCPSCKEKFEETCSEECCNFRKLPPEEQKELAKTRNFNGTKHGYGHYQTNISLEINNK
jgi:UPF0176 protein